MQQAISFISSLVFVASVICLCAVTGAPLAGEDTPTERHVRAYLDAMIERGRDRYGDQSSPLFACTLDRQTMAIGKQPSIPGVRQNDRAPFGANPYQHLALYDLLAEMVPANDEDRWSLARSDALQWFFANAQSPATGLMAWGEHLFWDFRREAAGHTTKSWHEIGGAWPHWAEIYATHPAVCQAFAIGLWEHQIHDHATGDFSRHADYHRHKTEGGAEFPRYAGQMILTWAELYHLGADDWAERDAVLPMIDTILNRMRANQREGGGLIAAGSHAKRENMAWPGSCLELARCAWLAAPLLPRMQAERLRDLALELDAAYLALPQMTDAVGFMNRITLDRGQLMRSQTAASTSWNIGYGAHIHAGGALKCLARADQLSESHPDLAAGYRAVAQRAADHYLAQAVPTDAVLVPMAFAQVIELLLAHAALDHRYGERAQEIATIAVETFLDDRSPLPKASSQHNHYEAITGGADLMLALLRLDRAGWAPEASVWPALSVASPSASGSTPRQPQLVAQAALPPLTGEPLYANPLASPADVADWVMEGPGQLSFSDGWMTMWSPNEQFHHVFWCPETFPSDVAITFEAQNLHVEAGLCIVFFAATGPSRAHVLDPSLRSRDGTFEQYIRGDVHCYHASYYANAAHRKDRGFTNLRKNPGFHLVQSGELGIPTTSTAVHRVAVVKRAGHIRLWVDDRLVLDWADGEDPLAGGSIGFRQMKWTQFRYRQLQVFALPPAD